LAALTDDSVSGIISTIGGEDSIRLLPFLDLDVIARHPKVFVGYSDTTVTHLAFFQAGVVSFYGPSIMSGFGENGGMHRYLADSFRRAVFNPEPPGIVRPNVSGWTVERLDWANPENQSRVRQLSPSTGWRFLQGEGVHRGHLLGGCLEVLSWLPGTRLWPAPEAWSGAILFLETSEEAPTPRFVERVLRQYAGAGILERLSGILFGRPGGSISPDVFPDYDAAILKVVRQEQGLVNLPVITGMDFGHTDPFFTLPYGVEAEIDCLEQEFRIVEAGVVP
jgi:muramoyltetrapeptide carboxypeptidase LdcA involved in peptidoglycan recycling